jgi:hypothetical protein
MFPENPGRSLEELVPRNMPKYAVDQLHTVQVSADDAQRQVAFRVHLLKLLEEKGARGDSRYRIA